MMRGPQHTNTRAVFGKSRLWFGMVVMVLVCGFVFGASTPSFAASISIDISNPGSGPGYTYTANLLTFDPSANSNVYTITGSTNTNAIVIGAGVDTVIILDNAVIDTPGTNISIASGATLELVLEGGTVNSLQSGGGGAGIHVPPGANLTVSGTGALTARGNASFAGIGGSGNITIEGGVITIPVSSTAAGIGGHSGGSAGNVTINGGTITATSYNGAAIGNGSGGGGGLVTINGGTINARSTWYGAAIGGGLNGNNPCTVIINDGDITAINANYGAAIGAAANWGGGPSNNNRVEIHGGTITASSNSRGAAIGGGQEGTDGGSGGSGGIIIITGGTVNATAPLTAIGGAGGGGHNGTSNGNGGDANISISGGTITATGGATVIGGGSGAGTGSGGNATVSITGGTVIANSTSGYGIGAGISDVGGVSGTTSLTVSNPAIVRATSGGSFPAIDDRISNSGNALITNARLLPPLFPAPIRIEVTDKTSGNALNEITLPANRPNFAYTASSTSVNLTALDSGGTKTHALVRDSDSSRDIPVLNPSLVVLPVRAIVLYQVSFDASPGYFDGDSSLNVITGYVLSGEAISQDEIPSIPSRAGYDFGGWYTDPGLTTPWDSRAPATQSIDLYAKWTRSAPPRPEFFTRVEISGTFLDGATSITNVTRVQDGSFGSVAAETVVTLTNQTTGSVYNGILSYGNTLVFKHIDYGTYVVTCVNPMDIELIGTSLSGDTFTLIRNGSTVAEESFTVSSRLRTTGGFSSIAEANNRMKINTPERLPNAPQLMSGMIPVKWVTTDEGTGGGYWVKTTPSDPDWFDYSQQKWANIMLADGLSVDPTTNEILSMGSMFVWVPRYAYQITYFDDYATQRAGYDTNSKEGLRGFSNRYGLVGTDGVTQTSNSFRAFGQMQVVFLNGTGDARTENTINYRVHPAFTFGDTELQGIWFAKFDASRTDATVSSMGSVNQISSKPNAQAWRFVTINDAFNLSRSMANTSNAYELEFIQADTHMMKNVEYGAAVYLSESKYGRNGYQIWKNPDASFITGRAGDTTVPAGFVAGTHEYYTVNGRKASGTGNPTGIYDLSGCLLMHTAAYVDNNHPALNQFAQSLLDAPEKYKDVYPISPGDVSVQNFQLLENTRFGDVLFETTQGLAWYSGTALYPFQHYPTFNFGGTLPSQYAYYFWNGATDPTVGFRSVIVGRY